MRTLKNKAQPYTSPRSSFSIHAPDIATEAMLFLKTTAAPIDENKYSNNQPMDTIFFGISCTGGRATCEPSGRFT